MRPSFRILLSVVAAVTVLYAALAASAVRRPPHPYYNGLWNDVLVIAHQGGDGLWPSNTLYAFERAAALGADVLELDVHLSADGELVVIHDDTVDRTTDGSGLVADKTVAELQQLDAGYRWSPERQGESFPYRDLGIVIPTLREVFAALPDARFNIEIKPPGGNVAGQLCALIREAAAVDRAVVVSFYQQALGDFRAACPEVASAAGPGEVRTLYLLSRLLLGGVYRASAEVMQVPEIQGDLRIVGAGFVRAAHAKRVRVDVWTVDDEASMRRLIDLDVDGIMTDRPDRLLRVLGRGGAVALPDGVPR